MPKSILARIMPFIFVGIAIVAFLFGLMLLAYLFVFGAIVGLGLFIISWLRDKFFPSKNVSIFSPKSDSRRGRTYDHDKFK